ncbi:tetratricopeptide repeat protein [Undibacterium sp. RTI2.1]|uniref:O-linked N-acetylglucosamine transferase family protein n=1 Tax=unclassified Undibacterium TaxID=2630295 RepID=UPI002AB39D33|nr:MULTISPECIES: tetratricopeptide repeat protein [unclassified Undibacterium]MDY7537135.1 tetratricopeptide repeat protein [Undibacterium sp. 5I1]MEB0029826.1 tetratricopeptide repeat protein [Undibacterium sp. RTI2.1]MEB0115111.1 tetratricopeptide repeat protein [Undibacterium sp. RTI2.2]MEB0229313.1 tetratricopeptide repeat protein [Undibacterium sp. 10I3]MEB0256139.1 tetratricopeptide repeat protein [Undibacterium sp. 5I1]
MSSENEVELSELTSPEQALAQALDQLMAMAQQCRQSGNLLKAEECYELILTHAPEHADANFQAGQLKLLQDDQLNALAYFERAIQASPATGSYWSSYIAILKSLGEESVVAEALNLRAHFLRDTTDHLTASESDQKTDNDPPIADNLPNLYIPKTRPLTSKKSFIPSEGVGQLVHLYEKGIYSEVERLARKLTKKNPRHGLAWRFLGIALLELERKEASLVAMQQAVRILPNDPIAHFNLALGYAKMNNFSSAEQHYQQAINLNPAMLEAYNNLGNLLAALSKFDEAESCFRALIQYKPEFALAHLNLANVLKQSERLQEAKAEAMLALKLAPDMAEAHNSLGGVLHLLEELDLASDHLQRAIALKPDFASAYNNLGTVYLEKRRYLDAQDCFRKALIHNPKMSAACRCLGVVGTLLAEPIEESEQFLRRALELDPKDHYANTALLFLLSEATHVTPTALFAEHLRFGERFESSLISTWSKHANDKNSDRPLRVGFVSGDFYNHAVATFISPILEHLHKYQSLELHAYYNNDEDDKDTAKLKFYFHQWKKIHLKSDDWTFKQIVADKIDILIDLSGHTSLNRLTLFARKPAPIQISWIGYPGTTGLRAMDYFVTDRFCLPSEQFDHLFSEKLVRLPAIAPFSPSPESPEVNDLPALTNGYVTFGSFNRIGKITDDVIQVWSNLLNVVPSSKLFLGAMPQDASFQHLIDAFSSRGISRDRLSFFGRCGMTLYLKQLQKIDICLDTFPYNGGTTTLHGLWMGVPTLTKAGSTVSARTGIGLLSHVGLQRCAVSNDEEFVKEGVYWVEHLDELAQLRASLRDRMRNSPLIKPELIAAGLDRAMQIMWQRWCKGLAAESFVVEEAELNVAKKWSSYE